ncbi:MAG: hypothetical protein Q9218_004515 [Villophora microphyllina]
MRLTFQQRNIDVAQLQYWITHSINSETRELDEEAAYKDVFGTKNGIIIAEGNYRGVDSQKKLPWSEIMYQTWALAEAHENALYSGGKKAAPGLPISNLQAIVRKIVVNQGTQSIIRSAYNANGFVPTKDGPDQ